MAYDAEKQMLRELANWVLPQLQCCFCQEFMLDQKEGERQGFGHRRHRKLLVEITFHHGPNEDREDNRIPIPGFGIKGNVNICHPHCHRKYHNAKRKAQNTEASTSLESGQRNEQTKTERVTSLP